MVNSFITLARFKNRYFDRAFFISTLMATKATKLKRVKKPPELYWNDLVSVWFNFCREKFDDTPSFDGSAPRDLKAIIVALRERAEKIPVEWTLGIAQHRLQHFLNYAWQDYWLSRNWLLSNINRQKDKIFFNIRAEVKKQSQDLPFD